MTPRTSIFAACAVALLSASPLNAESPHYLLVGAKGSDCKCSGCSDFLSGCSQKGGKSDKDYIAGEDMGIVEPDGGSDDFGLLAAGTGATPGGLSAIPGMIGDQLATSGNLSPSHGPSIPIAAGDRRFKISENMSPIPTDRVFFNYHHFHGALDAVDANGDPFRWTLDRYVFGAEKTFHDGLWSVELRLPVAAGLDSDQNIGGASYYGTEFGNISLIAKRFLWRNSCAAVTGGLAMTLPTASDARVYSRSTEIVSIENDAVFLQPYLGWIYAPTDRLFMQGFLAWDLDTGGNQINSFGQQVGVLQDQNLMFLDFTAGYWVYQNPCGAYLKGIAPMFELHYTTTLNDADFVGPIGNHANNVDILNCTGGVLLQLTDLSSLRVAGIAPLKTRSDRSFDAEVGVQFIRRF